jgi:3-oxoacyl-[acyl-carrier-protein] synthase-1
VLSACGIGLQSLLDTFEAGNTALQSPRQIAIDFTACTGEVDAALIPELPEPLRAYNTRNARIALAALEHPQDGVRAAVESAKVRYGAHRIGVVIGTSTSGIHETEQAYIEREQRGQFPESFDFARQHAWVATAHCLQQVLGVSGPCYAISTACSSSSKTLASAQRLIAAGVCDAVLTGGVDTLCRMTLYGFKSLDIMSETACRPLDRDRSGLSIGEGAGLLLLERPRAGLSDRVHLLGCGESSDAHHMTAPHPQGRGAVLAMQAALQQANMQPAAVDYVNLHATGTRLNDLSEMRAMGQVFTNGVACSATKGFTGHMLGAAGGMETAICWLSVQHGLRPGCCGLQTPDPAFNFSVNADYETNVPVRVAMNNNFGFGGNNTSLLLGRAHD